MDLVQVQVQAVVPGSEDIDFKRIQEQKEWRRTTVGVNDRWWSMVRTEQYSLILSRLYHVIHLTARRIGVVPGRQNGYTTWKVYNMYMIILYSELHIKKKLRQLSSDIFYLHNLHAHVH